jgi:RNA polymerase sigma factor (sigma-70 family)
MTTDAFNSKIPSLNLHQDLIEACSNGDQKAQFQIYKLYYKAMYNISLRIVNNQMEAEDIMQESFLSAFEGIARYNGTVTFGAWLRSIVQNRSIDSLRKNRKMSFENIEALGEGDENLCDHQVMAEESDIIMRRILAVIKYLPAKARNIFVLYFLEGYDYAEIGEILSISPSTSRSQLSRARSRFIAEFKGKY